jgi:uncharacterized protein YbcV (DUF1398 family)
MNVNVRNAVVECTRISDQEGLGFGDIVSKLIEVGVERYHTDLVRSEQTYYLPTGESEVVRADVIHGAPAVEFSPLEVEAAVRAFQVGTIKHKEFVRRLMAAGCVAYLVSITGRRVVYYGRNGDSHVEWFPNASEVAGATVN